MSGDDKLTAADSFEWDPLASSINDEAIAAQAKKREIRNVLKSYTGYYDLFAELTQNALDAVERRRGEGDATYTGQVWIEIDLAAGSVVVTDDGCGMTEAQLRHFVSPSISFKGLAGSRGNKGVGATYLAYGFNSFHVATKQGGFAIACALSDGRIWVDDNTGTVPSPKFQKWSPPGSHFSAISRGTAVGVTLSGPGIRPKDLRYIGATTAQQWAAVLRLVSPIGGLYFGAVPPSISISVEVTSPDGKSRTVESLTQPTYLYPHSTLGNCASLLDYLNDRLKRVEKGQDVDKPPAKFQKLDGIHATWSGVDVLAGVATLSPSLDASDKKLLSEAGVQIYAFLGYSTDLYDNYNDKKLMLREGHRVIRGGLQLACRNMPQGLPITIPLTKSIGLQNTAHVIVHFDNAEPDLGRKGFQPEYVRLAEKLSVAAVGVFRAHYQKLLRKRTGAPGFAAEVALQLWIDEQKSHEKTNPLSISGKGLFLPTETLPIKSAPVVEQDVVSLFNQMLSSGLIRGIEVLSTSQYKQYDCLYRIRMTPPYQRYLFSDENPLGLADEGLDQSKSVNESVVKVLEYKHSIDGLIEDFEAEDKSSTEIGLVVAWVVGSKWKSSFDVTSLLIPEHAHLRRTHGATHAFAHSSTGAFAFEAVVISELIRFLGNPASEAAYQRVTYP